MVAVQVAAVVDRWRWSRPGKTMPRRSVVAVNVRADFGTYLPSGSVSSPDTVTVSSLSVAPNSGQTAMLDSVSGWMPAPGTDQDRSVGLAPSGTSGQATSTMTGCPTLYSGESFI